MSGYIISNRKKINIKKHEIQSFDILCKTKYYSNIIGCRIFNPAPQKTIIQKTTIDDYNQY